MFMRIIIHIFIN